MFKTNAGLLPLYIYNYPDKIIPTDSMQVNKKPIFCYVSHT